MKCLAWICVAAWGIAACGSDPTPQPPEPPRDPDALTFVTADGTLASIGWTGIFHNIKGARGTSFSAQVTSCNNGVCQFQGPIELAEQTPPLPGVDPVERRRCLVRTSQTCTSNAVCPTDSPGNHTECVYIYDPPISTPLGGTDVKTGISEVGACALTYIPVHGADGGPTIQGALNVVSGKLDLDTLTVLLVLNARGSGGLPSGAFQGVCPVCVGDTRPNDGKKEGTCQASPPPPGATGLSDPGLDGGAPCDVNRYGELPGYNFGYSMDCSPTLTPGIGQPTQFGGRFSSSGVTMPLEAKNPKCTETSFAQANCFCGMCSNSPTPRECTADDQCGADGKCIGASLPDDPTSMLNAPVAANLCDDQVCHWSDAAGVGTCLTSKLGPPARPVGCYPSALTGTKDKAGSDVVIDAPGSAKVGENVFYANTASARCTPAGTSAVVNRQVGLPGLTFQRRNFEIVPSYAEDQK